eukprot:363671-Chlamydomonas_euryale.AAC.6
MTRRMQAIVRAEPLPLLKASSKNKIRRWRRPLVTRVNSANTGLSRVNLSCACGLRPDRCARLAGCNLLSSRAHTEYAG